MKDTPGCRSLSDRIYQALLLAYPPGFRHEYGAQMAQVFHDSCRDAQRRRGMVGLLALWLAALGDLAASAWAEWRTALQSSVHPTHLRGGAMLHITNGDSAAGTMRQAGLEGQVIAWRDVLHEGPVPADLALDQLSQLRARFLADCGWGRYEDILADFMQRDSALAQFHAHKEIVLWFEHDLYDQLQLIQLLDWFARQDLSTTMLSLICINAFPGIDNFHGLGQLNPTQIGSLYGTRRTVTAAQLALGSAAWQAFCAPEPTAIEALLSQDTTALPFLRAALLRHLEQFPAIGSGLSRTERQILEVVASGVQEPIAVFMAEQAREDHPFMGDSTLWSYIESLSSAHDPLLHADGGIFVPPDAGQHQGGLQQVLALTERGRAVLAGQADRLHSGIDRWLGGVHLRGSGAEWRWDAQGRRIVRAGG
jgi:Domain of unknown function (DUF1835)